MRFWRRGSATLGSVRAKLRIDSYMTQKLERPENYDFVKGWIGPDALSVIANSSDRACASSGRHAAAQRRSSSDAKTASRRRLAKSDCGCGEGDRTSPAGSHRLWKRRHMAGGTSSREYSSASGGRHCRRGRKSIRSVRLRISWCSREICCR